MAGDPPKLYRDSSLLVCLLCDCESVSLSWAWYVGCNPLQLFMLGVGGLFLFLFGSVMGMNDTSFFSEIRSHGGAVSRELRMIRRYCIVLLQCA